MNVALLLLMSPGSTISAGPLFTFVYSTGRYAAWSAAAFAFATSPCRRWATRLPNAGCARGERRPSE